MPTYDYRCTDHGDFELHQSMKDHAKGECPTCAAACKQVLTAAPGLDIEGMAKAGMPGAFEVVGDRLTKKFKAAGQSHKLPH